MRNNDNLPSTAESYLEDKIQNAKCIDFMLNACIANYSYPPTMEDRDAFEFERFGIPTIIDRNEEEARLKISQGENIVNIEGGWLAIKANYERGAVVPLLRQVERDISRIQGVIERYVREHPVNFYQDPNYTSSIKHRSALTTIVMSLQASEYR